LPDFGVRGKSNTQLQFVKKTFDSHSVLLYQYTHALNQCGTHRRKQENDHHYRRNLALRFGYWHGCHGICRSPPSLISIKSTHAKGNTIMITTIVTAWLSAVIVGMLGMAAGN
jgi:hypothetical protein